MVTHTVSLISNSFVPQWVLVFFFGRCRTFQTGSRDYSSSTSVLGIFCGYRSSHSTSQRYRPCALCFAWPLCLNTMNWNDTSQEDPSDCCAAPRPTPEGSFRDGESCPRPPNTANSLEQSGLDLRLLAEPGIPPSPHVQIMFWPFWLRNSLKSPRLWVKIPSPHYTWKIPPCSKFAGQMLKIRLGNFSR